MLLKRIEGKSLPEALERVRSECGPDALVVETRATRSGYLVVAARQEATPARAEVARPRDQVGRGFLSKWTRGFRELAETALDLGVSEAILAAVERALLGTRIDLSRPGDPALGGVATRVLASLIRTTGVVEPPEPPELPGCRAVAFVGPTGVGKTTTLAKLAARARSRGERIAIVTLDTYRVAAVEQLRAFADLLAVPFTVAFTASDLRRAVHEHRDCDRVYVDTTGKSPRDGNALATLQGLLRAGECATVLCLAAGTNRRDSDLVLQTYDGLGLDAVCLTKWDETVVPGASLSAVVERGLPLSHLCIGQEVPADIVTARPTDIAAAAFDTEAPKERT
ncbi:MAG: hypothetical protein KDE27_20105 [Planctomycetes bacterium]|nr:hypothetical protein [Planctomycetota bacterium]